MAMRAQHDESAQQQKDELYYHERVQANMDMSGEYRAAKYETVLGIRPPPNDSALALVQNFDVNISFEAIFHAMTTDGAVVLQQAVDKTMIQKMRQAHDNLLSRISLEIEEVRTFSPPTDAGRSFYQVERQVAGLRVRRGTRGRLDLKSLDHRDGGDLVRNNLKISDVIDPLICVDVVRRLLNCCARCPWRVMRVGSIVIDPGADAQDWHRDIGDGLFGEDIDMRLPDYYFNALIPLDAPFTWENGTEFVLGSHQVPTPELNAALAANADRRCLRAVANAEPGDIVVFNGKLLHRGLPNQTTHQRSFLYIVYAAQWYEQNRDQSSEYWKSSWHDLSPAKL